MKSFIPAGPVHSPLARVHQPAQLGPPALVHLGVLDAPLRHAHPEWITMQIFFFSKYSQKGVTSGSPRG